MGKMHRIFVAVGLERFGQTELMVGMGGVAAGIDRPHVPFGFAFGDPFSEDLAGPAALNNAEGERMGFKGVFDPGIGPISGKPSGA